MSSKVSIRIPKPCAEKWDGFELRKEGRFCQSCEKVVVDFTKMSDQELVAYLMRGSGKVCGRVYPSQLRQYTIGEPSLAFPGFGLVKAGLMSAILLLLDKSDATAQPRTPVSIEASQYSTPTDSVPKRSKKTPSSYFVQGTIHAAEDGSPLPGANVLEKGTYNGVVTDADGNFRFPNKLRKGSTIVIAFIGFETKEIVVSGSDDEVLEVNLKMEPDIVQLGGVEGHYGFFTRLWWKVKGIFY